MDIDGNGKEGTAYGALYNCHNVLLRMLLSHDCNADTAVYGEYRCHGAYDTGGMCHHQCVVEGVYTHGGDRRHDGGIAQGFADIPVQSSVVALGDNNGCRTGRDGTYDIATTFSQGYSRGLHYRYDMWLLADFITF